jgi:hypothetical protein
MMNFETETIVTIIGGFAVYATGLIGIYVNIRLKLKELEIRLTNLKVEVDTHRLERISHLSRLESRNSLEHDSITGKIDILIEKVTEIRVEQATVSATLDKSHK